MTTAAALQNTTVKPQQSSHLGHGGLLLQRKCACGSPTSSMTGECEECKSKKMGLQAKLTIGASNDPLEQEADRVADQVLAAPANAAVSSAPPRIQRFTGQSAGAADTAPASVDRVLASPGRPLEPALRQDMEQRFGHDFSRVRVHTGGVAEKSTRDVNANAYTVGDNIVFGERRFAPGTHEGRRLIAHELTHVVQQSSPDGISAGKSTENYILPPISPFSMNVLQRQPIDNPPASPSSVPKENKAPQQPEQESKVPSKVPDAKPTDEIVKGWRDAGLLDPPFRPNNVAPIPDFPVVKVVLASDSGPAVGASAGITTSALTQLSISPAPPVQAPPVQAPPVQAPPVQAPPVQAPPVQTPPVQTPPTGIGPGFKPIPSVPPLAGAAPIVAAGAGGVVFFWSTHGPAWADAINPYTGIGYRSKEDYDAVTKWSKQLTDQQRDYLRFLGRARRLQPDAAVETERPKTVSPGLLPSLQPGAVKGCFQAPIPRLGGNQRHDAYATQVTGTAFDFLVLPPNFLLAIAYDGLGPKRIVWEVKVGFEWLFNDAKKDLRITTLANWTIQKDRGLAAASACEYIHLWAIPSVHVAALLTALWGGTPFVLAIPEAGGSAPPRLPQ